VTGAAGTVNASPTPSSGAAVVSYPESEPVAQHAGDPGSTQSFTDVLSEQRGGAARQVAGRDDRSDQGEQGEASLSTKAAQPDPTADETVAASLTGPQLVPESAVSAAPSSDPAPQSAGTADAVGPTLSADDEPASSDVSVPSSDALAPSPNQAAPGLPATVDVGPAPSAPASPPSPGTATPSPAVDPGTSPAGRVDVAAVAPTPGETPPTLPAHGPASAVQNVTGPPPPSHGRPDAGSSGAAAARAVTETLDPPSLPTQTPFGRYQDTSTALAATASHVPGSVRSAGPVVTTPSAPFSEVVTNPLDVDGLSGALSRPLSDGNGAYTITVAMHPPELGHLQAVMSLDGNDLQVSITAQTQKGHDALSEAADALKNQLARGGVNVSVSLRDPGSRPDADQRRHGSRSDRDLVVPTEEPALSSAMPSGQIHLVL
jgi:hypothetical protein